MGDVPRTDALWNKLACPREPTGSLSEAITFHTRSDSPLVQRPERPAGRPTEAPNHLHSQSAQQRILQEHVTRVASGEGSSARAVDLHQLQIRPPRGGRLAAGAPASSSPPNRRCSPRRGLRRGQIVEERCHLAAAHEAPRAAAPRAPQMTSQVKSSRTKY